jgi:hypothetical protein
MFKVYWTNDEEQIGADDFDDMSKALAWTNSLRNMGYRFVTMVSENPNCTSKLGVDEVKDTANYDGWISRGRAP